ncbi:MAG: CAP domain-containing protein, partial [Clostridium sp.]
RQKVGAKPLKFNTTANKYARSKSAEMITLNYFAHESPKNGTIMDIAKKDGWKYSLIGENIYTSTGITDVKAKAIVDGWMSSPGHRENILRAGYEEIGIGVAIKGNKVMATQIFYTPAN